jgi:hypothetical protein
MMKICMLMRRDPHQSPGDQPLNLFNMGWIQTRKEKRFVCVTHEFGTGFCFILPCLSHTTVARFRKLSF